MVFLDIVLDFWVKMYICDSSGIGAIFNSQKYVNEKMRFSRLKILDTKR